MSITSPYPPLQADESGTMYIRGTRYKVLHLAAEHYVHGWTAEELMRQHPDLVPEQVYAALAFFYEHHAELVTKLNVSKGPQEDVRFQTLSRDELIERGISDT